MYMQSAMRERRGLGCACGDVAELNVGLIALKCDPVMNYWRDTIFETVVSKPILPLAKLFATVKCR